MSPTALEQPNQAATPRFKLIIVGDEILSGKRQDGHLVKTIELLKQRGLMLSSAQYVGDEPSDITRVLHLAWQDVQKHGDVFFCTGGIGATPDDHTRQCAAAALQVPLALHPEAAELIHQRGREIALEKGETYDASHSLSVHRLNMAMFPEGAHIIPNPYNKIAGFYCNSIYFFPGFPVMAWPMMEWVLDTHYAQHFHNNVQQERALIVMGTMEAKLTPLMQRIEADYPSVKVFSLPTVAHPTWGPHIELGVKSSLLEPLEAAFSALQSGLNTLHAPFQIKPTH